MSNDFDLIKLNLSSVAEKNGFELSENADNIINAKIRMFGDEWERCSSDPSNVERFCCSQLCQSEIRASGVCHCGLFKRKQEIEDENQSARGVIDNFLINTMVEHKSLFPDCTVESQLAKFEEEFNEYMNSKDVDCCIKELADCLIVCAGIYRFCSPLARLAAREIFSTAKDCFGVCPDCLVKEARRKWNINKSRKWVFDTVLGVYKHVGKDGNE